MFSNITDVMLHFESDSKLPTRNSEEPKIFMIRNDETIISSISVTDIFFDVYLGKWNYRAIPKVKTWSYFLTIPKQLKEAFQEEGFSLDDLVSPTKTRGCRQGSLKILANKNSQPRY